MAPRAVNATMAYADLDPSSSTKEKIYSKCLLESQEAWWRRLLNVQAPYGWNLRRLHPGFTLDIGCGLGRHLLHLGGNGVGIDHNPDSVRFARAQGLEVFTPEDFRGSPFNIPQRFDSLLLSHVAEHMTQAEVITLLSSYRELLKPQGKLIVIAPQEAGFRRDATHREFVDFQKAREIAGTLRLEVIKEYSFPLPRVFGKVFYFNEFVSVSLKK